MTDNILIKNNYYVTDNNTNDEFHIVIYYLKDNKCKIKIRRMDCTGWGQDLKIVISSLDNNSKDIISVGSSKQNIKIIEIYTNIKLYKIEYVEQLIPKIIIQTSNEPMNKSIYHYNSIITFIELNPEYEYKIFDDNECRKFIVDNKIDENNEYKNYFIEYYDKIMSGKIKAFLFKLYYLYVMGGCYFHCKMILKLPLCKIIDPSDTIILCGDVNNNFYEGIICVEKNNINIYNILKNEIINNILNKYILRDTFLGYIPKLKRNGNHIFLNDKLVLKKEYKDYKSNNEDKDFFSDFFYIKNYKFYFYPSEYPDQFDIIELKNNIFIVKRLDDTCGWGQYLKLKVIDTKTMDTYIIDIGNSDYNEKPFIIE